MNGKWRNGDLALKYAIPTIGNWRDYAAAAACSRTGLHGGRHDWPRLAVQVDRILRGELPGRDSPSEDNRTQFEFVINRKTSGKRSA